jgi:hypothetical protein
MSEDASRQLEADELCDLIYSALLDEARNYDRSRERGPALARKSRGLPAEVVDHGFSCALSRLLAFNPTNWELIRQVLVAAQQFASQAGGDRFGLLSQAVVAHALSGELALSTEPTNEAEDKIALCRARTYALGRAIGMSFTADEIISEDGLKRWHPLAWLDLVATELTPECLLDRLRDLLAEGAVDPFALVPRLSYWAVELGMGVAHGGFEMACRQLYAEGRYEAARELKDRMEDSEPRGWRLPLGGDAEGVLNITPTKVLIETFSKQMRFLESSDVAEAVLNLRTMLDPLLAFTEDSSEEADREKLRGEIFDQARLSRNYDAVCLMGVLPEFRRPDAFGFDWFQDGLFWDYRSRLINKPFSKDERLDVARKMGAHSYVEAPGPRPRRARAASSGQKSKSKLLAAGARLGFVSPHGSDR